MPFEAWSLPMMSSFVVWIASSTVTPVSSSKFAIRSSGMYASQFEMTRVPPSGSGEAEAVVSLAVSADDDVSSSEQADMTSTVAPSRAANRRNRV